MSDKHQEYIDWYGNDNDNNNSNSNSLKRRTSLNISIDSIDNNRSVLQSPISNNDGTRRNSFDNTPKSFDDDNNRRPSISSPSSVKRRASNASNNTNTNTNNGNNAKRSSQIFIKPIEQSEIADLKQLALTDITYDKDSAAHKALDSSSSSSRNHNVSGTEINQGHELYALTYGMMLGIYLYYYYYYQYYYNYRSYLIGIRVLTCNHAKISHARQVNHFIEITDKGNTNAYNTNTCHHYHHYDYN